MFNNQYIKPSFLIIGGVKCGTSSLYRYMVEHPSILPCKTKEPDFLTGKNPLKLIKGLKDYYALFPKKDARGVIETDWISLNSEGKLNDTKITQTIIPNQHYISGEATAKTFCFANPFYVKMMVPKAKLIMMVRNPTDRMYSHYQMLVRLVDQGKKEYDLPDFDTYIEDKLNKFKQGKRNIIRQGLYLQYLKKWEKVFGKDCLKVFHMNDLSTLKKGQLTLNEICDYLSLEHHDFSSFLSKRHNQAKYPDIPIKGKKLLDDFYKSHNLAFEKYFNISLI